MVTIFPPSLKDFGQQKDSKKKILTKTLVCVATGFYPDHVKVSWTFNDEDLDADDSRVATDSAALPEKNGTTYRISSRLRVNSEEWYYHLNKFTCTVSYYNGTQWTPHSASVSNEDVKQQSPNEKYLRITHNAKLSYTVLIAKSCFYGAFVVFLVIKLQVGKQKN